MSELAIMSSTGALRARGDLTTTTPQIRDADISAESANFARHQVPHKAGVAVLGQANALPNLALRLMG